MKIDIKETSLEESLKVFNKIPEWDRPEAGTVDFCQKKIDNKNHLILSSYVDGENAGYLIAYEKNDSFYCWVVAVDPKYRRMGIHTQMMNRFIEYAKSNNFKRVSLKTVNNKRAMLSYLVENDWNFIEVIRKEKEELNEIIVEKKIEE